MMGASSSFLHLWSVLNDLSALTIMALIAVPIPGPAKIIYIYILAFAQMDVLPSDQIYE